MATNNKSADNRTMATDAVATIGMLIPEDAGRDAIHLATEPVIAGEKLHAGQHIGFLPDGTVGTAATELLGIVDPFLTAPVFPGNRFWLVVYPRTITSLRHVWTHPSFEAAEIAVPKPQDTASANSKEASEAWLRNFIANADCPDYHTTIAAALNGGDSSWSDEYLHFDGSDAHGDIPPEFWDHVEIVTGEKITHRPAYFSCSC